jgi:hypothetical protein
VKGLTSLLASNELASIATRLALGAFPIVFLLVVRWTLGKQAFDLAAAALNWATYLNILMLSGFVLVPPAVARLRLATYVVDTSRDDDCRVLRDHLVLGRWLLALGVLATAFLVATIERTFATLAAEDGAALRFWFLLFAMFALSQIPMTFWLGVAQATGRYRLAFALTALPRAGALVLLPAASAIGIGWGVAIALSLISVFVGQLFLGAAARRALHNIDARILVGPTDVRSVLFSNLNAGFVSLVGSLVSIVPVTLVGRLVPSQVGAAQVIVGISNAFGAVVASGYFPLSLTLSQRFLDQGGVARYCLGIVRGAGLLTLIALLFVAAAGGICACLADTCQPAVLWTAALVLAGAGLRLGALGTQHIALYQGRPHLSLLSATAEGIVALSILLATLPTLELYALGVALLVGGGLRFVVALAVERRWLVER